ncbi:hypothetical protein CBR_g38144 [Chara braunii]|uniref:Protein kinase domain-containing protein n=1 Tax=Chara braunii TaxID=69332 RepID=A0A388LPA4_CHABU|nr:hypothetical protein CBR_g38144 [Chara braunii]|eukprot:GBG84170.1 hypothetical protein CBR_g38144 [Chara braunii]
MNQYHIYEAIGRGKHSVVYKGRKKKTIQYYAIKSVDKSQKSKVLQEVRTLHSLDHENVLKFHAWYETSNHLWLILEYCVGGDLLTLLRQDTRLPEESIHDFARDLLCDFGLARRLSDIAKSSVQQLPQAKRGTPCYMAPELFQEGGVHSFMSDLWALGCVMYECAAGRPPFVSSSFAQLVKAVLTEPPPQLPGKPHRDFEDLVMRLLMKDPCERMGWDELRDHPFWRTKYKILPLPLQPALENFLRQRGRREDGGVGCVRASIMAKVGADGLDLGLRDGQYGDENSMGARDPGSAGKGTVGDRQAMAEKTDSGTNASVRAHGGAGGQPNSAAGVTVLRLSKIVRSNMRREAEGEAYRQGGVRGSGDHDVTLANNDVELDFAEAAEEEACEEEEEESGSTGAGTPGQLAREDSGGTLSPRERRGTGDSGGSAERENGDSARVVGEDGKSDESTDPFKSGASRPDASAGVSGAGVGRKAPRGAGVAADDRERRVSGAGNANGTVKRNSDDDGRTGNDGGVPSKAGLVSLSDVMWHALDSSVKPIVLNRRIEKLQEPTFELRALPVDALSAANVVALQTDQVQLHEFLKAIMGSISGATQAQEKINTLSYLETLCVDTDAANVLINSPLMSFLVKMLRSMKQPLVRIKLVSVMGLLIRHATVIEDEFVGSGAVPMLTDVLRDKQDRVRRRAMAALGELLFYIATQHASHQDISSKAENGSGSAGASRDGMSSLVWQVPNSTIALVASMLRKGEDETTQHYAVKTIENIASQSGEWGVKFATVDVVLNLVHIMLTSKLEHLRTTAGSTVVRLVRRNPALLPYVMDKLGVKILVRGLAESTSRSQQVYVCLMNLLLAGPPAVGKHVTALADEKSLVSNVVTMLEHSADVLRGKALVLAMLLSKANLRWLMALCNAKMVLAIERLARDKDAYVQLCVQALVQTVASLVPALMDQISFDIDRLGNRQRPTSAGGSAASSLVRPSSALGGGGAGGLGTTAGAGYASRGPIMLFSVLLHLVTSQTFRGRVVDQGLLTQLAGYLRRLETLSFQGQDEFLNMILHVLEALSQHTGILLEHRDTFVAYVLPRLASMYSKSGNGDTRCLCLKIFADILGLYIEDLAAKASGAGNGHPTAARALSAVAASGSVSGSSVEKARIDSMVTQHFLPLYPSLLQDEDPMPLYAQKLLITLLEHSCVSIGDVLRLRIVPRLFDFILADLNNVNKHAMKLCVLLAASMEIETRLLSEMRIVRKLGGLLEDVVEKGHDEHVAPILSICRSLMERHLQAVQSSRGAGSGTGVGVVGVADITEFGRSAEVFLELTGSYEASVADPAGECVLWFARAVPRVATAALLVNVGKLSKVLETVSTAHVQPLLSKLQRCLLLALAVCCREHRAVLANAREFGSSVPSITIAPQTEFALLEGILLRLRKCSNVGVMEAATEAVAELQLMLRRA